MIDERAKVDKEASPNATPEADRVSGVRVTADVIEVTAWSPNVYRILGDPVAGVSVPASDENMWANGVAERMGFKG